MKNYTLSKKTDRRCTFKEYGVPDVCGCSTCVDFKKHWLEWVYAKESYNHPMTLPSLISALECGNYGGTREEPVWLVGEYLYTYDSDFVYYTKLSGLLSEHEIDSLGRKLLMFKNGVKGKVA